MSNSFREIKIGVVVPCFFKSVLWLCLNSLFGLGPLFSIIVLKKGISTTSDLYPMLKWSIVWEKITNEGIIMFFCSAIMGAVAIDYLLAKVELGKVFSWLIGAFAMIAYLSVCFTFSVLYFTHNVLDIKSIQTFQFGLIWFSLFYSMFLKIILFYNEKVI